MNPQEIAKLLAWAGDGSRTLYFAFAVANDEGLLCLHKYHKGKAILHDLINANDDLDLRTRRFGTVSTDLETSRLNFETNKAFGSRELKALKGVLRVTRMKSFEIAFNEVALAED